MSYDIYDLGLNAWLSKSELVPPYQDKSVSGLALASLGGGLSASLIEDGEVLNLATVAKKSFSDTTAGKIEGLDTDGVYKWLIGNATSSVDWAVTTAATLTVTGAIVSDSGVLGGWNILSGYIYNLQSGTPIAAPNDGVVLASGNEAIIIYEDTAKRIELGYLASGIYGLKGYDTGGSNVMFELSDTQMIIAGWTISQTTLANGTNIILDASNKAISINSATYGAEGVQIQYNAGDPRAYIGDGANQFVQFDGTNLSWKGTNTELTAAGAFTASSATITGSITATGGAIGGFTIGSDYITDLADSFGLSSNVTAGNDVRFWAGATFANRASAPFIVYENGYFVAEYGSLNAGLTLGNGSTKSGTITMSLADTYGDVYVAGGTFNATTWTATNGFILGIDDSDSNKEKFFIGGATSSLDWNVTSLDTLTVKGTVNATAGYIGASTAAIFESTGLNLGTTGHVRGGQTAYNTGSGFFLGYDTAAYKLSIGNSADPLNLLLWTGSQLIVNGTPLSSQDVYGDGSDGDVDINSGAFSSGPITSNALTRDAFFDDLTLSGGDLNCAGYRLFVKGTLTLNNGYKIHRNGNNGGNGGNASGVTAGSAGSAGTALSDGSVKGGTAGVAGLVGATGLTSTNSNGTNGNAGTVGASVAKILGVAGAAGGASGDAGQGGDINPGGSGQTGGAAGSGTGTVYNKPYSSMAAYLLYDFLPSGDNLKSSAGSGSGAGGASGGALGSPSNVKSGAGGGGGGSGSTGGILSIFAKTLVNNGTIEAKGGTGGNGGNGGNGDQNGQTDWAAGGGGGGGGGAGGSGGVIIIVYSTKSGAGSTSVVGGSGGTKGTKGTGTSGGAYAGQSADGNDGIDGTAGNSGTLIELTV